jgi:hypothetical protein
MDTGTGTATIHAAWSAELKAFEASRRGRYQESLESLTLSYQSYCNLLEAGVHETAKAYRVCLGTAKAHGRLAKALEEPSTNAEDGINCTTSKHTSLSGGKELITFLKETNEAMVQQFGDSQAEIEESSVASLDNLLQMTRETEKDVKREGSNVLKVLQQLEDRVGKAWETYFKAALKYSRKHQTDNSPLSLPSDSTPSSPLKSKSAGDIWLLEFDYRNAVASQTNIWSELSASLDALFQTAKDSECMRRINLREFMIIFVRQQQTPFGGKVKDTQQSALKGLVETETNRAEIEEDVQRSIQQRLAQATAEGESASTDRVTVVEMYRGQFRPEYLLESEYLKGAFVLERKLSGWSADGTIVLAVATTDSTLHLFDLPDNIGLGSSLEEAVGVLFPMAEPPSLGVPCEAWSGSLRPSCTMELANCTVAVIRNETVVEILETGSSKRILLGVSSPEEREAVLAAM